MNTTTTPAVEKSDPKSWSAPKKPTTSVGPELKLVRRTPPKPMYQLSQADIALGWMPPEGV